MFSSVVTACVSVTCTPGKEKTTCRGCSVRKEFRPVSCLDLRFSGAATEHYNTVTRLQTVWSNAYQGMGPQRRGSCASRRSAASPNRAAAAPALRATRSSEAAWAPHLSLCSIMKHLRFLSTVHIICLEFLRASCRDLQGPSEGGQYRHSAGISTAGCP